MSSADVHVPSSGSEEKGQEPPDKLIARFAERQYGLVTIAQLRDIGLNSGAIGYRQKVGRLHRL